MGEREISEARSLELRASMAALRRAAQIAREIAIQTNTGIVVCRDGKLVHISAVELREGAR